VPEVPLVTSDAVTPDRATAAQSPSVRSRWRVVSEWVVVVIAAVTVSLLLRSYAFQTFYIPSASMEPTLQVGDRLMVNKLSVEFGTINVGDVVVFKAPATENCGEKVADLVKRVIGTPGDVLTSKGNTIYVNGKPLDEKWPHTEPLGPAIGHVTVSANQYFVMGDNHADSCDSRSWGTVPRSDIIGKAFVRFWPLSRVAWL
jgi:signal peptidase I